MVGTDRLSVKSECLANLAVRTEPVGAKSLSQLQSGLLSRLKNDVLLHLLNLLQSCSKLAPLVASVWNLSVN
jgi:hypothetical protein